MDRIGGILCVLLIFIAILLIGVKGCRDVTHPEGQEYLLDNGTKAVLIDRRDFSRDIGSPTLRLQWQTPDGKIYKAWFCESEITKIGK